MQTPESSSEAITKSKSSFSLFGLVDAFTGSATSADSSEASNIIDNSHDRDDQKEEHSDEQATRPIATSASHASLLPLSKTAPQTPSRANVSVNMTGNATDSPGGADLPSAHQLISDKPEYYSKTDVCNSFGSV